MRGALRARGDGIEIRVRVQPRASKTEFAGLHGDRLKLRVQAKPVENAANEAVVKYIAWTTGVAKSEIEILRGAASREKDLWVPCQDPTAVAARIAEAAGLREA
ncbi:MAG TPA: DUF167 family protein [Sumerlaeia bacterium]|nr:DUF167 family protein [Sumerlaeia bacterium]